MLYNTSKLYPENKHAQYLKIVLKGRKKQLWHHAFAKVDPHDLVSRCLLL